MSKENFNRIKPDPKLQSEKGGYFLGRVVLRDVSKILDVAMQKVYFVSFKNGARTKMHYHEGGQVLVVTHGSGFLVLFKRSRKNNGFVIKKQAVIKLTSGDVVNIPKQTLHWHGASKGKCLTHIAFNSFSKGKEAKTIWFDSDFKSYAKRIS